MIEHLSHCHPARRLGHGLLALDPGCPPSEEGPLPYPRGRRTSKPREVLRSRAPRHTESRGRALPWSPEEGLAPLSAKPKSLRGRERFAGRGSVGGDPPKPHFSGIRHRLLRLSCRSCSPYGRRIGKSRHCAPPFFMAPSLRTAEKIFPVQKWSFPSGSRLFVFGKSTPQGNLIARNRCFVETTSKNPLSTGKVLP